MVSNRAKKIQAALDDLDALPLHELTIEEKLTLLVQLETLRLMLPTVARCSDRLAAS